MSVSALCSRVSMSRQNYYRRRSARMALKVDEDLIVQLVLRIRRHSPRMGTRKLLVLLKPDLSAAGISLGRDRLGDILRRRGLLVPPLPKSPRTTCSHHVLPVFANLIAGAEPERPNRVWVSDLTYVRSEEGFVYLSVIMDLYSRKIVGFHCGDTLESVGCVRALQTALSTLEDVRGLIHHSDRGCQYCCHEYVAALQARGIRISMTEENHCYENAHAERVIGILKQEYGLGSVFRDRETVRRAVCQAARTYNRLRPHAALAYRTPAEVHEQAA